MIEKTPTTDPASNFDENVPSDIDVQRVCVFVGYLTINWSWMERSMDNMAMLAQRRLGGVYGVKKLPGPLSSKLDYLKRAFDKIPLFNRHEDAVRQLMLDTEVAVEKRHHIIHGIVDFAGTDSYLFQKWNTKGQDREITELVVDAQSRSLLQKEFSELAFRWSALSQILHKAYLAENGS